MLAAALMTAEANTVKYLAPAGGEQILLQKPQSLRMIFDYPPNRIQGNTTQDYISVCLRPALQLSVPSAMLLALAAR